MYKNIFKEEMSSLFHINTYYLLKDVNIKFRTRLLVDIKCSFQKLKYRRPKNHLKKNQRDR